MQDGLTHDYREIKDSNGVQSLQPKQSRLRQWLRRTTRTGLLLDGCGPEIKMGTLKICEGAL